MSVDMGEAVPHLPASEFGSRPDSTRLPSANILVRTGIVGKACLSRIRLPALPTECVHGSSILMWLLHVIVAVAVVRGVAVELHSCSSSRSVRSRQWLHALAC